MEPPSCTQHIPAIKSWWCVRRLGSPRGFRSADSGCMNTSQSRAPKHCVRAKASPLGENSTSVAFLRGKLLCDPSLTPMKRSSRSDLFPTVTASHRLSGDHDMLVALLVFRDNEHFPLLSRRVER